MKHGLRPIREISGLILLLMISGWTHGVELLSDKATTQPQKTSAITIAGLTEDDLLKYSRRFEKEIWPLLTRGNNSCVACHDDQSESQLHFAEEPDAAFKRLLTEGRLNPSNSSSMIPRLISTDKKKRMPKPPTKPWTEAEVSLLKKFGSDIYGQMKDGAKMDEQFPMELLADWLGKPQQAGPDNTFITYYQLKRKVKQIFNDEWRRDGKDLFNENITLFHGADFVRSFNESATASATFLSGMDLLSADLASRAYTTMSGPFAGRAASLPPPVGKKSPDSAYKKEITRLFNRILFRDPTDAELMDAYKLIQNVYREQDQLGQNAQELRFELNVTDDEGQSSRADITIPLTSSSCGLYQQFINQDVRGSTNELLKQKLDREFTFKSGNDEQRFMIANAGTSGNVSIAGIELTGPLPEKTTKTILVSDKSVQILGAWTLKDKTFASYEDNNEDKGNASIAIPIRVEKEGKYELTVSWRRNEALPGKDKKGRPTGAVRNSQSVMVEVLSQDPTQHASRPVSEIPPKGEAHFKIDQTISNTPYTDLKTVFQFGPNDGVEINNANTIRQVVADAVYFVKDKATNSRLLVKGVEAEGNEKWQEFKPGQFKPYNTVGPKLLSDNNQQKGELKLLYKPASKPDQFKPEIFYGIQIVCPGKAGNETEAPVIVHAQKSSPIIQINHPLHALVGGEITIDASATYNLQRGNLKYSWTQTAGPQVDLKDAQSPKLVFAAPALKAQQAAWEGLARALIKHPDFLFTRPPSIASITDKKTKTRLQLVKIAQDLVGRTPNDEEFKRLEKGEPLSKFIDAYLDSKEFRDFYFHRIRLVLESHGSEVDDEPARLWSYVCYNDRPFKEILTADYTVNKKFEKIDRPAYHGKSGVLTMKGFIEGKPGLPHFNYAAVVCEKFLGYVFEVPASIVAMRDTATAATLTSPESVCYSCHKILSPLAYQRTKWTDNGEYREKDDKGRPIDATDHKLVDSYPFKGEGMEAFALQAQNKERFIRTMIQTHFVFYFGREMRYEDEERVLYKRLWENVHANNFSIRSMLRTLMNSPEYLEAQPAAMMMKK